MNADGNLAKAIFLEAVEKHDPEQWPAFLDQACAGRPELRGRVEGLLQAHQEARTGQHPEEDGIPVTRCGTVGREPVLAALGSVTERPGTRIGPYRLLEQIGEGGFGVVFLAEQQQPVRRKVALKVLKPGMDSKQVTARFEAERQALALMDHPNIAKVLGGGQTGGGRPYFVMDLVKGLPITDYCDQAQLTTKERLELFVHVCRAVQHAHTKGVIHRDLKPSNVLVTVQDGAPLVKVIDFGIAKALGQQLTDKTLFTGFAQLIGTPLYMSPEQAALSNVDVDTRSDIYSLGVLLYELLTGTTPFDRERFRGAGYDELRRIIREEEPPRPSTRVSTLGKAATTVSAQRKSDPRRLCQLVRGELDWVVMKALEKDRGRRYETASAFAADVQRYLADEPVQACPPSAKYRLRKFARRNRTGLAVAGLIVFFIALLGGGAGWVVRDRAARRGQAARDLERTLDRAELLQGQGKRQQALAALQRAEPLADEAAMGPDLGERLAALKETLDAEARDQEFLERFEEIRWRVQGRADVARGRFTPEAAFPDLGEALRRYGIEIGVTPAEQAAARVRGRPERARKYLLAALDECLTLAPQGDAQARQWLLAVLAAADNDPWRAPVRKALVDRDWPKLEGLARAADVRKQPPSFLLNVARGLPAEMKSSRLELFRKIQRTYPADLWANHELAFELANNKQPAEAIRYYMAALALTPENPGIYNNRGIAFKDAGEWDAAFADYRQALALAPHYAKAHFNLAVALALNHQYAEAIPEYRAYFRQEAGDAVAHYDFGFALQQNGQLDEAIVEYRKAIALKKDFAQAHFNLGQSLGAKGHLDEAISELRKAVHYNPKDALNHYGLGNALLIKGRLDQAIAEYREALRIKPDYTAVGNDLRRAERLARLDKRLPAVLEGKDRPKNAGECLAFAQLCRPPHREQYAGAARFFGEAFAAEPSLAKDLQALHRYDAACAAALAGCGRGQDADKLEAPERARLRRQALDWLRADLEARRRLLEDEPGGAGPGLPGQLRHWLADPDFAGVRGPEALARLPEAEGQAWQKLWDDVADLLKRAQGKAAAQKKADAK
jgi:serine/threonine protein kinase/Flp pilus assembly protein TadD